MVVHFNDCFTFQCNNDDDDDNAFSTMDKVHVNILRPK